MKVLSWILIVVLLSSCSSSKKKEEAPAVSAELAPQVQVIHPQTFSPEELKRLELLERYKKMREETLLRKAKVQEVKKEKAPLKEKLMKPVLKMKPTSDENRESVKASSTNLNPTPETNGDVKMSDELRIQLDQHMSYYCIKFESRFSRPADCRAHAENALKNCQDKKIQDPSLNLVQCLKKNM